MKRLDIKKVLDTKVKQSMAGYKSNYNKGIIHARNASERQALLNARDRWIANKHREVVEQVALDVTNWINEHK